MLLSNLTADSSVCKVLLNLEIRVIPHSSDPRHFYPVDSRSATSPTQAISSTDVASIFALPLLVDAFVKAVGTPVQNTPNDSPPKAGLHFLSSVFANVSAVSTRTCKAEHSSVRCR